MDIEDFAPSDPIFLNREVLTREHMPDKIVARNEVLVKLRDTIKPVMDNGIPDHVFLVGPPGVGKTVCLTYVLELLLQAAEKFEMQINVLEADCAMSPTAYKIGIDLVNQLVDPADTLSTTGYAMPDVYKPLWYELDRRGGAFIIVLDNIQELNHDKVFALLSRARSSGFIENAYIGVVGVSTDRFWDDVLRSPTKSTLRGPTVHFGRYNAGALQMILAEQAAHAFRNGVLQDGVIERCAALGARGKGHTAPRGQKGGNARWTLDLLRTAGDVANTEDATKVEEVHVVRAEKRLEETRIKSEMKHLRKPDQYVLAALTSLLIQRSEPARASDIHPQYQLLCHHLNEQPRKARWTRNALKTFRERNITTTDQVHKGRDGNYDLHQSRLDPSRMEKILSECCGVSLHEFHDRYLDAAD